MGQIIILENNNDIVKTLNEFIEWAARFKDGQYLFRGVTKETYGIEASACRRLPVADQNNPTKLLKINQELIADMLPMLKHRGSFVLTLGDMPK